MKPFKCDKCGKFISVQDIADGKCDQRDHWSWDKMELIDVYYICPACTEKEPQDEKGQQKERGE